MCVIYHSCCYYTPTHRVRAILQSPCLSVHTFVTDISASTGRNDFIFDIWLWHGDLCGVLCLPFPGLPHIYFLFTVRLTNERVGVFLARRSVQHLVINRTPTDPIKPHFYTPASRRGRVYTVLPLSVRPRYFSSHFSQ